MPQLGALSHLFFDWEGSSAKIGYRKKGTLIPACLLEDLVKDQRQPLEHCESNPGRSQATMICACQQVAAKTTPLLWQPEARSNWFVTPILDCFADLNG